MDFRPPARRPRHPRPARALPRRLEGTQAPRGDQIRERTGGRLRRDACPPLYRRRPLRELSEVVGRAHTHTATGFRSRHGSSPIPDSPGHRQLSVFRSGTSTPLSLSCSTTTSPSGGHPCCPSTSFLNRVRKSLAGACQAAQWLRTRFSPHSCHSPPPPQAVSSGLRRLRIRATRRHLRNGRDPLRKPQTA